MPIIKISRWEETLQRLENELVAKIISDRCHHGHCRSREECARRSVGAALAMAFMQGMNSVSIEAARQRLERALEKSAGEEHRRR